MANIGNHNKTYGCGSCGGSPTVTYPPVPKGCTDCIIVPTIRWGCDIGPSPGETVTFNIATEGNLTLPAGSNYVYSLFDFNEKAFNSVVVSSNGDVTYTLKNIYNNREEYRIRYKVKEVNGIKSNTGEIYVCMANQCKNCTGKCDPLTGDCLLMNDVSILVDCGQTFSHVMANWNVDGIIIDEKPICLTTLVYNASTKTLTSMVIPNGCQIGVPLQIKVTGIKGSVSEQRIVTVMIKDKSIGVICDPYYIANKCTGDCEPINNNLAVTDSNNLSVN